MSLAALGPGVVHVYTIDTPNGKQYSVRVYHDELTAHDGPDLLDPVLARIRPEYAKRLDPFLREHYAKDMLSALHTMALLGRDRPSKRGLWV